MGSSSSFEGLNSRRTRPSTPLRGALRVTFSGWCVGLPTARILPALQSFMSDDLLPELSELTAEEFGTIDGGGRPSADGTPRKRYAEEDKERALLSLLRCGRDLNKCAEVTGINRATLYEWSHKSRADLYHELRVKYGQQLEDELVGDIKEIVAAQAQVELDITHRLREEVPNLDIRDLAKAAQSMAVAKDKNIRDYLTLQGRPVQVTEQRSPDKALEELKRLGVLVDSDADEVQNDESPRDTL